MESPEIPLEIEAELDFGDRRFQELILWVRRSSDEKPRAGDPTLWQGLLTLPLGRPKVSNPRETYGPGDGGVWRPAPNR